MLYVQYIRDKPEYMINKRIVRLIIINRRYG